MTPDKTILIGGVWEIGAEAALPVIDPATETEVARVASASADQVARAVEAAAAAQPASTVC